MCIKMNKMEKMSKENPLILVFYVDRDLVSSRKIIEPFIYSVNDLISKKEANILTFFLPTDGEERVDCINPTQVEEADMNKIMSMVDDISKSFDIGQGADYGKNDSDNIINTSKDE